MFTRDFLVDIINPFMYYLDDPIKYYQALI